MSCRDFTDDEIREELALLGYHNVPQDKLEDFKKDLMKLISAERSKSSSLNGSGVLESESDFKDSHPQKHANTGSFGKVNSSDQETLWMGNGLYEDWQYQGEDKNWSRPMTAPLQDNCVNKATSDGSSNFTLKSSSSSYPMRKGSSECDDVSVTDSESRMMKRKTSRKMADGCRLVDESFTDSESGLFEIYDRITNLAMRECECGKTRPKSGDIEPPYRIKGKPNNNPSVIKTSKPPHTRNLVRTNINERHTMYQTMWKARPPIGEDNRISLRKAVHAKLLRHDEVKKKQKIYVPNMYVPPHEKKRRDLRWRVRLAFENYELPSHGFYHEN